MSGRKFGAFLFVLAVGCAITASFLVINMVNSYRDVAVVVKVNKDIPPFTAITDKDISTEEVPKAVISSKTVTDSRKLVGKYSRTWIPSGTIVQTDQLSSVENAGDGVALPLSEMKKGDMRAVGIPEQFIQVLGSGIKDQDHLDLVGVFQDENQSEKISFAKTIAYGVRVLRINNKEQGGGVIVAVTAKQAEELALAMNYGKLVVSLTPYEFESKPLPGTFLQSLYITHTKGGNTPK